MASFAWPFPIIGAERYMYLKFQSKNLFLNVLYQKDPKEHYIKRYKKIDQVSLGVCCLGSPVGHLELKKL